MQQTSTSSLANNAPGDGRVTRTFNVEQDHNHIHGGWNTEIYVPPALPLQRSRALTPAGVGADDRAAGGGDARVARLPLCLPATGYQGRSTPAPTRCATPRWSPTCTACCRCSG